MAKDTIKGLRTINDLTQEDMAILIGCSTNTYIQKEKGRKNFTKDEMKTIKKYFCLTLAQFWTIFFEEELNENEIK